jgi:hypothetical protein
MARGAPAELEQLSTSADAVRRDGQAQRGSFGPFLPCVSRKETQSP